MIGLYVVIAITRSTGYAKHLICSHLEKKKQHNKPEAQTIEVILNRQCGPQMREMKINIGDIPTTGP